MTPRRETPWKSSSAASDTLAAHRVANTYKGVVIDANVTHDIKSALFNGGVAGSGAAVNGTVNVNRINGSTASAVKNTAFSTNADVNVLANDFSNSAGLVGTASAAGTGAGVGLSVNVLKTKDKTSTAVKDSDITLAGNANVKDQCHPQDRR